MYAFSFAPANHFVPSCFLVLSLPLHLFLIIYLTQLLSSHHFLFKIIFWTFLEHTVYLLQPFLCFQLFIPKNKKTATKFSFVVSIMDKDGTKRRLDFSTSFSDVKSSPLHAQLPLSILKRGMWFTLCVDLQDIIENTFKTEFKSIDTIKIGADCRIRNVFTLKVPPVDTTKDEELYGWKPRYSEYENIPRNLDFPIGVQNEVQIFSFTKLDMRSAIESEQAKAQARFPPSPTSRNLIAIRQHSDQKHGRKKSGKGGKPSMHLAFGSRYPTKPQGTPSSAAGPVSASPSRRHQHQQQHHNQMQMKSPQSQRRTSGGPHRNVKNLSPVHAAQIRRRGSNPANNKLSPDKNTRDGEHTNVEAAQPSPLPRRHGKSRPSPRQTGKPVRKPRVGERGDKRNSLVSPSRWKRSPTNEDLMLAASPTAERNFPWDIEGTSRSTTLAPLTVAPNHHVKVNIETNRQGTPSRYRYGPIDASVSASMDEEPFTSNPQPPGASSPTGEVAKTPKRDKKILRRNLFGKNPLGEPPLLEKPQIGGISGGETMLSPSQRGYPVVRGRGGPHENKPHGRELPSPSMGIVAPGAQQLKPKAATVSPSHSRYTNHPRRLGPSDPSYTPQAPNAPHHSSPSSASLNHPPSTAVHSLLGVNNGHSIANPNNQPTVVPPQTNPNRGGGGSKKFGSYSQQTSGRHRYLPSDAFLSGESLGDSDLVEGAVSREWSDSTSGIDEVAPVSIDELHRPAAPLSQYRENESFPSHSPHNPHVSPSQRSSNGAVTRALSQTSQMSSTSAGHYSAAASPTHPSAPSPKLSTKEEQASINAPNVPTNPNAGGRTTTTKFLLAQFDDESDASDWSSDSDVEGAVFLSSNLVSMARDSFEAPVEEEHDATLDSDTVTPRNGANMMHGFNFPSNGFGSNGNRAASPHQFAPPISIPSRSMARSKEYSPDSLGGNSPHSPLDQQLRNSAEILVSRLRESLTIVDSQENDIVTNPWDANLHHGEEPGFPVMNSTETLASIDFRDGYDDEDVAVGEPQYPQSHMSQFTHTRYDSPPSGSHTPIQSPDRMMGLRPFTPPVHGVPPSSSHSTPSRGITGDVRRSPSHNLPSSHHGHDQPLGSPYKDSSSPPVYLESQSFAMAKTPTRKQNAAASNGSFQGRSLSASPSTEKTLGAIKSRGKLTPVSPMRGSRVDDSNGPTQSIGGSKATNSLENKIPSAAQPPTSSTPSSSSSSSVTAPSKPKSGLSQSSVSRGGAGVPASAVIGSPKLRAVRLPNKPKLKDEYGFLKTLSSSKQNPKGNSKAVPPATISSPVSASGQVGSSQQMPRPSFSNRSTPLQIKTNKIGNLATPPRYRYLQDSPPVTPGGTTLDQEPRPRKKVGASPGPGRKVVYRGGATNNDPFGDQNTSYPH